MSETEIATDLLTPLGAYLRLREQSAGAFLLESVERGRLGRHSFVGAGSRLVSFEEAEALGEPVFGYLGYDAVARFEPTVPLPDDGPDTPESLFLVPDVLVRFDHARGVAELLARRRERAGRAGAGRPARCRRARRRSCASRRARSTCGASSGRRSTSARATCSRSSSRSAPSGRRPRRRSSSTARSAASIRRRTSSSSSSATSRSWAARRRRSSSAAAREQS